MKLKKLWYRLIKKSPADMPSIKYWKYQEKQEAKVTRNKDGALIMKILGEDQDFPGFPRGYLLFGKLSRLKHEIKNQIFNYAWQKLEEKTPEEEIIREIKTEVFDRIFQLSEDTKYDRIPYERMYKPVKEIYRAWTKAASSNCSLKLRDILTFILQEDDSYRFRVQFLVAYFNPNKWWMRLLGKDIVKQFEKALWMVERAEVIGDMKDKVKLLRRILLLVLKDESTKNKFLSFCKEVDWRKVKLSEADKYHFRGKYFKVDMDLFDY